jgi:hypothetical protein
VAAIVAAVAAARARAPAPALPSRSEEPDTPPRALEAVARFVIQYHFRNPTEITMKIKTKVRGGGRNCGTIDIFI